MFIALINEDDALGGDWWNNLQLSVALQLMNVLIIFILLPDQEL